MPTEMKTLEELRDKYLGALALAISKHDLKPDDAYEALSIIMDEALRAAERRGIERAADHVQREHMSAEIDGYQAAATIRALAQGGE